MRHPFPLRDQPEKEWYRIEFIQSMGRGVERVVETERKREREQRSRGRS